MTIATENTPRTLHLLDLMKKGDDAFNDRDFSRMNAVHHPDMVAHVAGSVEPVRGIDDHAATMKGMFAMFPDVHVNNDPYPIQFGSGDWTTVITRVTGTFTGGMTLPDGTVIPPTGKSFDVDFATTARWEGDLLVEEFVSWDSAMQAAQIGLA